MVDADLPAALGAARERAAAALGRRASRADGHPRLAPQSEHDERGDEPSHAREIPFCEHTGPRKELSIRTGHGDSTVQLGARRSRVTAMGIFFRGRGVACDSRERRSLASRPRTRRITHFLVFLVFLVALGAAPSAHAQAPAETGGPKALVVVGVIAPDAPSALASSVTERLGALATELGYRIVPRAAGAAPDLESGSGLAAIASASGASRALHVQVAGIAGARTLHMGVAGGLDVGAVALAPSGRLGGCSGSSDPAFDAAWGDFRAFSLVPLVGPWLQLAVLPTASNFWPFWLVLDGLVQASGFVALLGGIIDEATRATAGPTRPRVSAWLSPQLAGLSVSGSI
jgi:hypothetical protein